MTGADDRPAVVDTLVRGRKPRVASSRLPAPSVTDAAVQGRRTTRSPATTSSHARSAGRKKTASSRRTNDVTPREETGRSHSAPIGVASHDGVIGGRPFTVPHFRAWALELVLDNGGPWILEGFQEAFIRDLFEGRPENWLIVPEGNAKTTLVAGLALYHMEFRAFADVNVAASSREQAGIMYRQMEGFVLRTPRLHELVESPIAKAKGKRKLLEPRFDCLEGYRRINFYAGGRIQILAADDATGDGIIPTLALIDELHRHRDLSLYRTWAGKLDKRKGQLVTISTAGEPGSEFEQTRERIRENAVVTRKGAFLRAVAPDLVMHEWAVPEGANVEDIRVVKSANPLKAITLESLRRKLAKPTMTLSHWKRFVCNIPTRGEQAAIQEIEWSKALAGEKLGEFKEIPPGVPVIVGLDIGWKFDTTAAVPLWTPSEDFWLLGDATILTPPRDGSMMDPVLIQTALRGIHARNPIAALVMDPSFANDIYKWAERELGVRVLERAQSLSMQAAEYAAFTENLRAGHLRHTGHAGLTQHVLNAIAVMNRYGAIVFERPNPSRNSAEQDLRVIDALKAAAMAVAQHVLEGKRKKPAPAAPRKVVGF